LNVRILPRALAELEAWIEHIRKDNSAAAAAFAAKVFTTIQMLANKDFEGAESVLRTGQRVRSWPIPPMRIYYQRQDDELRVLRIYHQARRPIARR
jgi:plasmid stabilization system protein ParE